MCFLHVYPLAAPPVYGTPRHAPCVVHYQWLCLKVNPLMEMVSHTFQWAYVDRGEYFKSF